MRVCVQPEEVSFKSDAGGEQQQRTHLNEDAHRKYVLNPLSFKTQAHTHTNRHANPTQAQQHCAAGAGCSRASRSKGQVGVTQRGRPAPCCSDIIRDQQAELMFVKHPPDELPTRRRGGGRGLPCQAILVQSSVSIGECVCRASAPPPHPQLPEAAKKVVNLPDWFQWEKLKEKGGKKRSH